MLVTATLFALLEGTRYQEIRRFAYLQTDVALESVFSNYHQQLWQQYRLLGTNQSEAEQILWSVADARNQGSGVSLLRFGANNATLSDKTLLTDGKGAVFVKCVSQYMKDNIIYELAKGIYNQYESVRQLLNANDVSMNKIDEALEELDKLKESESARGRSGSSFLITVLENAQTWKENLTLSLFVENINEISSAKVDSSNDMFHRKISTGTSVNDTGTDWLDRILLQQYLLTYLSNYESCMNGRALSYEAEYLIGESSSDKENLLAVISRILVIREAANFISLLSDPVKVQKAQDLSLAIGGVAINPLVAEMIFIAILTAWSFAESIVDIRGLLMGKKIPLMKSSETWRLNLEDISLINEKFITSKECSNGLTYKDYLGVLLLSENELEIAWRAMNVEEYTMRNLAVDTTFRMDDLMVKAEAEINYVYAPLFPFLPIIDADGRWEFGISTKREFAYD